MIRQNIKYITLGFLLFFLVGITNIYAASDYGNINTRTVQNKTMINNANNLSRVSVSRYYDKTLRDLPFTSYKSLTSTQTKELKNIVDNSILGVEKDSMNDEDKVLKIYKYIVDNFIYSNVGNPNIEMSKRDNPYYIFANPDQDGKMIARTNGFVSSLIALVRTQDIGARPVGGHYNKDAENVSYDWNNEISKLKTNHIFVQVYVNGSWKVMDPMYDNILEKESDYFNPVIEDLSKTHIMFTDYPGSKSVKYLSNNYEKGKIVKFLNKVSNKKTNGKRVNSGYKSSTPSTWFASSTSSKGTGFGNVEEIYWAPNKGLYGSLDLSGFSSLKVLSVYNNKLTSLNLANCPSISTVSVAYNKMSRIVVTGSKNLKLLSARGNSSSYIKYNYGKTKRLAIIKSTTGGVVSVRYEKIGNTHKHILRTSAKSGYKFKGWYKGTKRISTKQVLTVYNTQSYTYTAKYVKKNYIVVSIKDQKLWYYKNGVLKLSSKVVTGHKNKYDTPKGTYKILGKARSVYLIGRDYRTFVNYWMVISSKYQIGLHDATWRYSFGGSIYKYDGSHGCINLPYEKAKYLYYNAPKGTQVVVK